MVDKAYEGAVCLENYREAIVEQPVRCPRHELLQDVGLSLYSDQLH